MKEDPNKKANQQRPGQPEDHAGQKKGQNTNYVQKRPQGNRDVEDEDEKQDQGGMRRAS
jgi:hypothetical protein